MTGKYRVVVRNNKVQFTLDIERNITIIQGESARGKTTLVEMLGLYQRFGRKSGISVSCSAKTAVCTAPMWQMFIENTHNSIIFIDEGNDFVVTREFAEKVKASDCYFVIVTRENLYQLPYSVNSILQLRTTAKRSKVTYSRAFPVYDRLDSLISGDGYTFLTEDKGAGNEMFSHIAALYKTKCISADGKSNIKKIIKAQSEDKFIITADGAAFGADMADVYRMISDRGEQFMLYLPESFEWMILSSDIIHSAGLEDILNAPWEYVKSEEFISWERYFTHLLTELTKGTPLQYDKTKLAKAYLTKENIRKIINVMTAER